MPPSKRPKPRSRPAAEPAPAPEPSTAAARDEALLKNLASLRDLLAGGVVLTAQRLQESIDDAVARGRMTRRDAEDLASGLLASGRAQTQDLMSDLETMVGRGRSEVAGAVKESSDRVLREVEKARRVTGRGGSAPARFPIAHYEDLTAKQVVAELDGLGSDELRRVRDREQGGAARKTVLAAVDRRLA